MTTTIMRDSIVGDAWIQQSMSSVPIQPIVNPETGQPTGDYLTGPVRLGFVDLFSPQRKDKPEDPDKYGCTILFPPGVDFTPLHLAYNEVCAQAFPEYFDQATSQYQGLHSPFRDQAEKSRYPGYTPGSVFMSLSTNYKPPVTDINQNPVVDAAKAYAGCWAICAVNAYNFSVKGKKGVSFGLQNVMLIGDDTKIGGGGGTDNKKQFAGVNITAPVVRPELAQAVGALPNGAPAATGIPGYSAPVGSPAPQAGFTPAAPVGAAPVLNPQTGTTQTSVPPATSSPFSGMNFDWENQ